MTAEQQTKFNILNEAWATLEPHIKVKDVYKKIMSDLFKMFFKKRGEQFTDEWWQNAGNEFLDYPKKYWGTPYYNFAEELSMGFLNFWEYCAKLKSDDGTFKQCMEVAFEKEGKRVGQKRISA